MKILIVHLSDLHISNEDSPLLRRHAQVADAVKNLAYELDLCVIAVTGDVAFSGCEEQYTRAGEFLASIRGRLSRAWRDLVPIHFVLVPGNHDCDFSADLPGRDSLLSAAAQRDLPSAETVELCTQVQDEFFEMRDAIAYDGLKPQSRLYYEYEFALGTHSILFRCCNTAWLSKLREIQSSLAFPIGVVPIARADQDVVITLFHHPYHWLAADNSRAFRRHVEESSDIILTGHDHDFAKRTMAGGRGERNVYIEGSPLQLGNNPDNSEFNALVLDTALRRQKVCHFSWSGGLYSETPPPASWEDYQVSQLRNRERYEISQEFLQYLNDPGTILTHPSKRTLTLSDVYVHPDVRKVVLPPNKPGESLRGEALLSFIVENSRILITGPEQCGKTALAKRLFLDFHEKGYVPVLLRGEQTRLYEDADRTYGSIEFEYRNQYRSPSLETFKQLDRAKRVIIIDDIHKVRLGRKALAGAARNLTHFAGQVILLADDLTQQVSEIMGVGVDSGTTFPHFRIQQFGFVRRNELAERWFALDPNVSDDDELYARKLVEAKRLMDTAIGHNYVPSFPVFILPVLQAHQHNEAVDVRASTYGYFYELLIRRALSSDASREDLDVKLGYLAYVAYAAFDRTLGPIFEERDLRKIHEEYETRYLIPVSFAGIVRNLTECSILTKEGEAKYQFKYPFIYYYFIASYIKDHLTELPVQAAVTNLCEHIHEERNANILLFLAHLSKDPFIIDQMLGRARGVFKDSRPATLNADESPIPLIDKALDEVVYEEKATVDSRAAILRQLDADAESRREREEQQVIEKGNEYLERVGEAFRTLQILGQVVKNFPGTLEGSLKLKVTKECYDLGLRSLQSIMDTIRASTDEFVRAFVDTIRYGEPGLAPEELLKRARESIHGLTTLGAYGMIRRIANAVGSPNLTKVYEQVRGDEPPPSIELVHAALELEQLQAFPQDHIIELGRTLAKNPIASRILKGLVVSHFHLFNVKFQTKQHICQKLGIPYKPLQGADARRLLSSTSKK